MLSDVTSNRWRAGALRIPVPGTGARGRPVTRRRGQGSALRPIPRLVRAADRDGTPGPAITTSSAGGGPFGFDFDRASHLLVSDAALITGQSGATSYDVARDGTVTANGPAVPIDQAAACRLAAAGSTLVENNPASHPLDESVSAGQHYLYVLADGLSQIVGYRVGGDGSLTQVITARPPQAPAASALTQTHQSAERLWGAGNQDHPRLPRVMWPHDLTVRATGHTEVPCSRG